MKLTNTLSLWALQLLAEASGDAGDTAGAAARQTAGDKCAAGEPGSEAPAAGVQRSPEETFEELIRGPYKKAFDEKMQRTISLRLKQHREELARFHALAPTLEQLAGKFGVKASDTQALLQAMDAAAKAPPEDYDPEPGAQALADHWLRQEQQMKLDFPEFDLKRELSDERFRQLLRQGVGIGDAYALCHRREHLVRAMAYAVGTTRSLLAQQLAARGQRPRENGLAASGAVVSRREVSRFTGSDIDAIRRRVEKGERISFG